MTDDIETPDFSGDDLGHHKEVQLARAARKAYEKLVQDSFAILSNTLGVTEAAHPNLESFLMFSSLQPNLSASYVAAHSQTTLHVSLVQYESSLTIGKYQYSGNEEYLFGHFSLHQQYPRTYACKETLREKLTDMLMQTDVDVEHNKKFSSSFHVVTEDKNRLLSLLQYRNLDLLATFPDLEFELFEKGCLFRYSKKPVSPETAQAFADAALALMETLR